MRTTVELPPDLMKQAKTIAAARGESLKTLLTRAVASEIGKPRHPRGKGKRVNLPLFGDPKGRPVELRAKDIACALAEDDMTTAQKALRLRLK